LESVAKRKKDETQELPGIDWVLGQEDEQVEAEGPEEASQVAGTGPAEVKADDLPKPGDTPTPEAVSPPPAPSGAPQAGRGSKSRVKKGEVPQAKGGPSERPKGRARQVLDRGLHLLKEKMGLIIPDDPVERLRWRLRWLGIVKFPILFTVYVTISILMIMFLWFILIDYDLMVRIYSREVPALVFVIPACIGLFCALYFSTNIIVLDRMERRMTAQLEAMLEGLALEKGRKDEGGKAAPKPEEARPEAT
jgi:hypothetical protein